MREQEQIERGDRYMGGMALVILNLIVIFWFMVHTLTTGAALRAQGITTQAQIAELRGMAEKALAPQPMLKQRKSWWHK